MKTAHRSLIWLLNVVLVSGAIAQDKAVDANGAKAPQNPVGAVLPEPANTALEAAPLRMARGFQLRADGTLLGQVDYIDESSLALHPVSNAIVTFIQNRAVIAQQRTGRNGEFEVKGLTPSAVYSVFVTSPDWFTAIAVVTYPHQKPRAGENPSAAKDPINRLGVLVSTQAGVRLPAKLTAANRERLVNQDGEIQILQIQLIPREDFVAALRTGVLGNDLGGSIPGGFGGGPGGLGGGFGGGGGGVGGGGGGSGGGGGGGGFGGAIGSLGAIGAAAGAAGASSSRRGRASSPFAP